MSSTNPTTLTVTLGEQNFLPKPYSGFKIGPFSITVDVGFDETPQQAHSRGMAILVPIAKAAFIESRNLYYELYAARS